MGAISNNAFSHDQQVADVVPRLEGSTYNAFYRVFPEWDALVWSGSRVDAEASQVDPEYISWATDWIESNTAIYWEDGEPWIDD